MRLKSFVSPEAQRTEKTPTKVFLFYFRACGLHRLSNLYKLGNTVGQILSIIHFCVKILLIHVQETNDVQWNQDSSFFVNHHTRTRVEIILLFCSLKYALNEMLCVRLVLQLVHAGDITVHELPDAVCEERFRMQVESRTYRVIDFFIVC
jgi:hypothetical protein